MAFDEKTMKAIGTFVGGILMGSVGFKALASKDARKVYVQATAMGMRAKESIMESVTCVQENANDIVAEAKAVNEERAATENELPD